MAKTGDIALDPAEPFARAAARVVRVRADELVDALDGVLDTSDIEKVHDARVASRRLRAVLEIFQPAFPSKQHAKALKEVKRLADALGERRDPDVHLDALTKFREQVSVVQRPGLDSLMAEQRAQQERGNVAVADALARLAERDLRTQLHELADAAAALAPGGDPEEPTVDDDQPGDDAPRTPDAEHRAPDELASDLPAAPGPPARTSLDPDAPAVIEPAEADPTAIPGAAGTTDRAVDRGPDGTPIPDPPPDAEPVPVDEAHEPVQPAEPDPAREPDDGWAQDAQDRQVPS